MSSNSYSISESLTSRLALFLPQVEKTMTADVWVWEAALLQRLLSNLTKKQGSLCWTKRRQWTENARWLPTMLCRTRHHGALTLAGPQYFREPRRLFIAEMVQMNFPYDLGKCHHDSCWWQTDFPAPPDAGGCLSTITHFLTPGSDNSKCKEASS